MVFQTPKLQKTQQVGHGGFLLQDGVDSCYGKRGWLERCVLESIPTRLNPFHSEDLSRVLHFHPGKHFSN